MKKNILSEDRSKIEQRENMCNAVTSWKIEDGISTLYHKLQRMQYSNADVFCKVSELQKSEALNIAKFKS